MAKKIFICGLIGLLSIGVSVAQRKADPVKFINQQHNWVDSVFNTLSPKERIAQLFLVRAHTNLGQNYIDSVRKVIEAEQLGGLVVFQGGPVRHVQMFNQYQQVSKVPLLISSDGEWGLGMRMPDSTISYPYQMTLGAIQNDHLIYEMGRQVARDFKRIGMHFNFAPVVDINNNPNNPVINFRSFGDDKMSVTQKGKAYMQGMIDGGIFASLKHFPGHGDTDVDSHHDLPQLPFDRARLDSLEIYPFGELIQAGAPAVMVAHMNIPALDDTPNIPSSISRKIVTDILRDELGFKGLSVTDAMDMHGVKKFFPDGQADVMAIMAGNDLLEISENSARAINLVAEAVESGKIAQSDLDARVKKVLAAKLWLGLDQGGYTNPIGLYDDLNSPSAKTLVQRIADAAVTLVKSDRGLRRFDTKQETAIVSIGIDEAQDFERGLSRRLDTYTQYFVQGTEDEEDLKEVLKAARGHRQVVLVVHDNRARPASELKLNQATTDFIDRLAGRRTISVMLTNPYALNSVDVMRSASILIGYQNDSFMQRAVLKGLLGQIIPTGKLPVNISEELHTGAGI